MKKILTIIFLSISLNSYSQDKQIAWITDVNEAITLSVKTQKPILFFFTGSDWCGWCIRLQKAVFSKKEFYSWASDNVIPVELDFPRRKKLSVELERQNRELANIFGVRGYPTVWFVNPEVESGKVNLQKLGTQGASPLDVNAWITGAKKIISTSK